MHHPDKNKEKAAKEAEVKAASDEKNEQPEKNVSSKVEKSDEKQSVNKAEKVDKKDEQVQLSEKIELLEKKLLEAEDNRLRLLAEMDNQRKRALKDQENTRLTAVGDTVSPFLQVFDHFSMAVKASEKSDKLQTLLDGMKMIASEFDKAFSELGIERIEAVGKDFDPNLHEAVSQENSDTVPAGKVIRQWSCGYRSPKRLYKPAMVVVSSGPEKNA